MSVTMERLWGGGDIGVFTSMRVIESPLLPFDSMVVDTFDNVVLVGEVDHLRWRMWIYRDWVTSVADVYSAPLELLAQSLGLR